MWQPFATHILRKTPDYLCDIDEYRDEAGHSFLQIHFTVFSWSRSILKQLLSEWRIWRSICTAPIFAIGEVDNDKWKHFVSLFGFKPLMPVVCQNGEQRMMFVSYPNVFPAAATAS